MIDKSRQMDFNRMESFPAPGTKPMNVQVSCELYARLSAIPLLLNPTETRKYLKSLYIERKNGKLYAVVTNVKTAAIECLGEETGPDECTAIVIDPVLIAQCQKEISFNSSLSIVANDMLKFTSIKTAFGYSHPGNAMVEMPEVKNELPGWRDWFPDEIPTKSSGAMFWTTALIHALATASPTGGLRFPKHIDTTCPVVVCDQESANWVGLFMPSPIGENPPAVEPATIPEWL